MAHRRLRGGFETLALVASLLATGACKKQSSDAPRPDLSAASPARVTSEAPSPAVPSAAPGAADAAASGDVIATEQGPLRVVPVFHGMLRLEHAGKVIYVDPHKADEIPDAPRADLVLITDVHADHFDPEGLAKVSQPSTKIVAPPAVVEKEQRALPLKNGETANVAGVAIEAVPMYNLKRGPKPGTVFHEKGRGNGYILRLGGRRVYIAGDTECTDEMRALTNIDVAFLPMNLPYTMPPEEAAECARAFKPKIVYPFHYRGSDPSVFHKALADVPGVEVRLREWYPGGA